MKFAIKNRWDGRVLYSTKISAEIAGHSASTQLGFVIKKAVKKAINLQGANLQRANLQGADLRGAYLRGADLQGADLRGARNLEEARDYKLAIAQTRILPEGDIIGWKKCENDVIVKLLIPASAARSHAFGRKCRAEFVYVLKVFGASEGTSMTVQGPHTVYRAGERVSPSSFSHDWKEECAPGIHFYITREEAEAHIQ